MWCDIGCRGPLFYVYNTQNLQNNSRFNPKNGLEMIVPRSRKELKMKNIRQLVATNTIAPDLFWTICI